jgi:hypothetical protein
MLKDVWGQWKECAKRASGNNTTVKTDLPIYNQTHVSNYGYCWFIYALSMRVFTKLILRVVVNIIFEDCVNIPC